MDQATMLAAKSSVGVTPDVNLSNPFHKSEKYISKKLYRISYRATFSIHIDVCHIPTLNIFITWNNDKTKFIVGYNILGVNPNIQPLSVFIFIHYKILKKKRSSPINYD